MSNQENVKQIGYEAMAFNAVITITGCLYYDGMTAHDLMFIALIAYPNLEILDKQGDLELIAKLVIDQYEYTPPFEHKCKECGMVSMIGDLELFQCPYCFTVNHRHDYGNR